VEGLAGASIAGITACPETGNLDGVAMSPISKQQLQEFQDLLSRRESQLREEVRAVKESSERPAEVPAREAAELVEAADDRVLSGLDHVQLLRDQEELVEIAAARERLRDGHYGLCSKCGKPIPLGRLRVLPTARLCLEHQAEWERTHPAAPQFMV
jgi:DnaK suppressor protein